MVTGRRADPSIARKMAADLARCRQMSLSAAPRSNVSDAYRGRSRPCLSCQPRSILRIATLLTFRAISPSADVAWTTGRPAGFEPLRTRPCHLAPDLANGINLESPTRLHQHLLRLA